MKVKHSSCNETIDGVAVVSTALYASHLHLDPERQSCQHLITQFLPMRR